MQPTLEFGSTGDAVRRLKQLLNEKVTPRPNLLLSDFFDRQTKAAVRWYQVQQWLVIDGVVGPCTWNALLGLETFKVEVQTNLVPQPSESTCWAAATAMLLGLADPVPNVEGVADETGLENDSASSTPVHTERFARAYGLTRVSGHTWMPVALASMLQDHGRLMADVLWNTDDYVRGRGSSGHMVVISGLRGTANPMETTIRIYDPWPVRAGRIYSRNYARLMRALPTFSYELYYSPVSLFNWGQCR